MGGTEEWRSQETGAAAGLPGGGRWRRGLVSGLPPQPLLQHIAQFTVTLLSQLPPLDTAANERETASGQLQGQESVGWEARGLEGVRRAPEALGSHPAGLCEGMSPSLTSGAELQPVLCPTEDNSHPVSFRSSSDHFEK